MDISVNDKSKKMISRQGKYHSFTLEYSG